MATPTSSLVGVLVHFNACFYPNCRLDLHLHSNSTLIISLVQHFHYLSLQLDYQTGELVSSLTIHNMSQHVFQTYYIIAENYVGERKHGIRAEAGKMSYCHDMGLILYTCDSNLELTNH